MEESGLKEWAQELRGRFGTRLAVREREKDRIGYRKIGANEKNEKQVEDESKLEKNVKPPR